MTKQPNVILISTDQQRGDCIGPEGRGVRTPNIDKIGKRGVRFSKCTTAHPMCQAARSSILTGKLPYSHGVRDNGRDLDESFGPQGLAGIFGAAGYDTHFIGKAHLSSHQTFEPTGRAECYSSAKDFPASWSGDYFNFEDVQLILRPHHHAKWENAPETMHYENWLDADGNGQVRWELAKEHLPPKMKNFQAWSSALGDEWHTSPWVGDRTVDMLEEQADTPIFAWVSFPDPHPPFLAPKPWSDMYSPEEVVPAKNPTLDLDNRPWWHSEFLKSKSTIQQGEKHWAAGVDWGGFGDMSEEALREITAVYFGMISAIDSQVGRILDAIEAKGELDNTVIIFISDHGEWLGDHGLLLKGPMLYDGLLRVPCLISGPGVPADKVIDAPISTMDIRSTLMDLCGLDGEPDNGTSWKGLFDRTESREFALSEYEVDSQRSGVDLDLRTVRSQRYRMSVDLRTDTGELYDLENDPGEMVNLFDDPGSQTIRKLHMDMVHSRAEDQIPRSPRVGWH